MSAPMQQPMQQPTPQPRVRKRTTRNTIFLLVALTAVCTLCGVTGIIYLAGNKATDNTRVRRRRDTGGHGQLSH